MWRLRFETEPELPHIHGNGIQIRQVILNLVKNGADAVGARRGRVTVRTRAIRADRALLDGAAVGSSAREGNYVAIEVSDDGAGMDKETLARSMEVFFTKKPGGRGIGLAVVVGAVQRHGGAMRVESAPGRGTTFQVLLPVETEHEAEEAAQDKPAARAGAKPNEMKTVLVVDDHQTVRDVICETFTRAGCSVLAAGDGAEAIQTFHDASRPIDCVVLDLTLPDMSGIEVFDRIRRERKDARVILTSGLDEQGTAQQVAKDPRAAFLAKPFTPGELMGAFETLTRR